jgi:hypothetical protein
VRRWRAGWRRVRRRCALIPGRADRPATLARRGRRPGIRAAAPGRRAGLRRTLSVTQEIVALGHCWPPRGDLRQFVIAGCRWSMVDGARPEAAAGAEFRVARTGMCPVSATSPWRRPAARSLRRLGDTATLGCGAPRTARHSVAALQFCRTVRSQYLGRRSLGTADCSVTQRNFASKSVAALQNRVRRFSYRAGLRGERRPSMSSGPARRIRTAG